MDGQRDGWRGDFKKGKKQGGANEEREKERKEKRTSGELDAKCFREGQTEGGNERKGGARRDNWTEGRRG